MPTFDLDLSLDSIAARTSFQGYVTTMAARGLRHIDGWVQTWWSALCQDTIDLAVRQACGVPGGLGGVQLCIPAQHGKSTLAAELAPCYGATRNPNLRTMLMTYSRELSARAITAANAILSDPAHQELSSIRVGRATSRVLDSAGRLVETSVQADARSNMLRFLRQMPDGRVERTQGYYLATSPKGGATGWGYDLGILDDLIKNQSEAYNPAHRDWLLETVRTCFFTRRSPSSAMIQILTRWHARDVGYQVVELWKKARIPYAVIELPAIALNEGPPRPYDPRAPGEPLDTARYGHEFYEQQRAMISEEEWWALYQQQPRLTTGASFLDEHWGRFDPEKLRSGKVVGRVVLSIDPNMGGGAGSSFAQVDVIAVVNTAEGKEAWKLHEVRGKWELVDLLREVLTLVKCWAPTDILIENAAAGGSLASFLCKRDALGPERKEAQGLFDGRRTYKIRRVQKGIRIHLLPHGGQAKGLRIELGSPYVTTGVCRLPGRSLGQISNRWVSDHLQEFRSWPQGANDDRLDSWTQFVRWAAGECGLRPRYHLFSAA